MVRAEDSRPRGRGFESCSILDGCKRFASYYIKRKIKNKGSQMRHTKKKKYKKKKNLEAHLEGTRGTLLCPKTVVENHCESTKMVN